MSQIWKTHLDMVSRETVIETMGLVLRVGLDAEGIPSVWYWAPEDNHKMASKIVLVFTGEPVQNWMGGYMGTFAYGSLVFHAFEQAV